jgi:hypothetical protein
MNNLMTENIYNLLNNEKQQEKSKKTLENQIEKIIQTNLKMNLFSQFDQMTSWVRGLTLASMYKSIVESMEHVVKIDRVNYLTIGPVLKQNPDTRENDQ